MFLDITSVGAESHGCAVVAPEVGNVVVQVDRKANNVERRVDALESEVAFSSTLIESNVVVGADLEPYAVHVEVDGLELNSTAAGSGDGRIGSLELFLSDVMLFEEHVDEILEVESGDVDFARASIQDRVKLISGI